MGEGHQREEGGEDTPTSLVVVCPLYLIPYSIQQIALNALQKLLVEIKRTILHNLETIAWYTSLN